MRKIYLMLIALLCSSQLTWAQCTLTNATGCNCLGGGTGCDLLPDITVARKPLTVLGSSGVIEYSQTGNGVENGRLRISVTTPNIGHGPMETRSSNQFVCGTDTFVGTAPTTCPDGSSPKIIINQRIYHKDGNVMTYYDRPAGTMTYHPTHGHQHVDNWGVYTLRTATADPNPLNWPIVGNGAKLAFCLLDIGACTSTGNNGLCIADNGDTLNLSSEFYGNYQLGGGSYGCSATLQGISVGYLDTYVQSLDGMYINIPPGTCNGTYYIVCQQDPANYFLEENDNNNVIAVPFTLTKQGGVVPTVTASGPTSFCSGGSVTLTSSGATSYLWSNGATTQSITVNQAGTYSCTVNGTSSCSTTSAPVAVSITPFPVTASTTTPSVCSGTTVQLNATSTGGGTITQVQSFTNNTSVSIPDNNSSGASSTIAVSGIVPTSLSSGMVVSLTANITHPYDGDLELQLISPSLQTVILSNRRGGSGDNFVNTTFSMSGSTAIANGSAPFTGTFIPDASINTFTGNANGNWRLKVIDRAAQDTGSINNWTLRINNQVTSSVTYAWSSSPAGFSSTTQNPTVNPTQTTNYAVTATQSGTGCTGSSSVAVNIVNPTVAVAGNSVICPGQSTTLTASGASSYAWSPATGLSATTGNSVTANPTTTTTYTVTGTANGCTDTETFTVTVTTTPTLTTSGDVTICEGQSTPLNVSGANSYVWSPANGLSATTGSAVTATPASTTTYLISGTVNGCATNNAQITVTVVPNPVVTSSGDISICNGSSASLSASGATTYSWSPSIGLSGTTGNNITANPSSTTTYTVVGTTNGCSASQQLTVTVNSLPVLVTSGNETVCENQSALLIVIGADSYSWSPATGLNSTTGNNILSTPASTTTYTVVGTSNGCSSSSQLTVTVNPLPVLTTSGDVTICDGGAATLTSAGADTYLWSPANGLNATTGNSVVASPTGTSTYTVTGTTNGCSGSTTITVIVNPIPVVTASNNVAICNGANTTLTASGANTYSWTPSSSLNSSTGSSVIASPSSTTTYSVTGTTNGCSSGAQVTVTVNNIPVVSTSSDIAICNAQSTALTSNGATTYSWSPSSSLNTPTGNSVIASPASTTTYTVTGTSNGCSSTAQVTVTVNSIPVVTTTGNIAVCNGQYATLTASGATTYSWSPSTALNTTSANEVVANPSSTITYNVIGTANGCSSTASVTVTVNANPVVGVSANTTSICNGQTATLTANGASTYAWSPSTGLSAITGTSVIASPSTTTTYVITGTSVSGCTGTNSITINANTGGSAPVQPGSISGNKKPCPGINEVYSVASVSGAVSYTWTVPSGITILSGQGTRILTVSISNAFSSGSIGVVANGNCGVSTLRSTGLTKNAPATPSTISGNLTGLCNATGTVTSSSVSGATSYTWTVPAGVTIASGQGTINPSIFVSSSFTSGNVCVTADNSCSSSIQRCVAIKKAPAQAASIGGLAAVCVSQQGVAYSTPAVFGATNYIWTVPTGSTIASGQGTTSIVVNFGTKTGNVAVTAANACGNNGTKTKAITFNCRVGNSASASENISVNPNPTEGLTNVLINSDKNSVALLKLVDVLGNTVMIKNVTTITGENYYPLDLSKFSKGVYMLTVKTTVEKQTLKVVLK